MAKSRKQITCEFYRVKFGLKPDVTPPDLCDVLQKLWTEKPTASDRNYDTQDGDIWRLHAFHLVGSNGCAGTILRIRTERGAEYAELDSDVLQDIPLGPGQHLVDHAAFYYDKEFQVIVIQRNRDLGSFMRIANYMRQMSCHVGLNFEIIENKHGLRRMNNLREINQFVLHLAVPYGNDVLTLFGKNEIEDESVNELINIGRKYNGTHITVIISQGRSQRQMATQKVKDLLTSVTGIFRKKGAKDGVDKMEGLLDAKVKGRHNPLVAEPFIDLIAHKLEHVEDVSYTGNKPIFSDYQEALQVSYTKRHEELRAQFE